MNIIYDSGLDTNSGNTQYWRCRSLVDLTCVQGTNDSLVFVSTCFGCYTWQAKDRE